MPRNAVEQFKVHSQFPIRWLPNEMNIVIIVWVQDTASKEYLKQYKILSTPLNFKGPPKTPPYSPYPPSRRSASAYAL